MALSSAVSQLPHNSHTGDKHGTLPYCILGDFYFTPCNHEVFILTA